MAGCRMAVYYYYLDDELADVQKRALCAFWTENSLGKRAFPSLAKLESDVVDFRPGAAERTGRRRQAPSRRAARKASSSRSRRRAMGPRNQRHPRAQFRRPADRPPGFSRAGHALGIDVRGVPTTRNDFKADIGAMASRIDDNTIGLVGSAPCYRSACSTRSASWGELALSRGLWLHVDCLRRRLPVALRQAAGSTRSPTGIFPYRAS